MAVNPYSFKDQHKEEWKQLQRQIGGKLTGETIYSPPPKPTPPPPLSIYSPPPIKTTQPLTGPLLPRTTFGPVGSPRGGSNAGGLSKTDLEDRYADALAIVVWFAIAYYGIKAHPSPESVDWLLPNWGWLILFGGAGGGTLKWLLCRHLRIVLRTIRRVVNVLLVAGFAYIVYAFFTHSYPFTGQ